MIKKCILNFRKIFISLIIAMSPIVLSSCGISLGVACNVIRAYNYETTAVGLNIGGATEFESSRGCVSKIRQDISWQTAILWRSAATPTFFGYTVHIGGASTSSAFGSICGYNNPSMTRSMVENVLAKPCQYAYPGQFQSSTYVGASNHTFSNWASY